MTIPIAYNIVVAQLFKSLFKHTKFKIVRIMHITYATTIDIFLSRIIDDIYIQIEDIKTANIISMINSRIILEILKPPK